MESERYGTFAGHDSSRSDTGALIRDRPSSRTSKLVRYALALGAVGAVAALAWTGGSAVPVGVTSPQLGMLSTASSAETTTDVERQFLSGVDRGRLRDFQHKYSR